MAFSFQMSFLSSCLSYSKKDLQAFAWKAQLLMQSVLTQKTPVWGARESQGSESSSIAGRTTTVPSSFLSLWRIHRLSLAMFKKLEFFNLEGPKRWYLVDTCIMVLILFFLKKFVSVFLISWKRITYSNGKISIVLCWIKRNTFVLM